MKSICLFYLSFVRRQIGIYISMVVVPVLMPYVFNLIMNSIS